MYRVLCATGAYSCRYCGDLTSSLLLENERQLSEPFEFDIFLMCVDMVDTATGRLETGGSRMTATVVDTQVDDVPFALFGNLFEGIVVL